MSKNDFRTFFASVKPFIKMSFFLRRAGIAPSTFYMFMQSEHQNYQISEERLKALYDDVCRTLANIA